MPNVNEKEAGDNVYPQFNRVVTTPVGTGAITKGHLYTKNDDGQLVALSARGNFLNGMFQAARSVPASTTAGTHSVQVYGPGSRVLLKGPADLVVGHLVEYTAGTTNILKKLALTSAGVTVADYLAKVGRIFEIYTQTDIATPKQKTVANDLVVVELGQG